MPVANVRCPWATTPASIAYHDREWGTPVRDDRTLFEFIVLEGAQAGLSWETVLAKRERYREVFANFEIALRVSPSRTARWLGIEPFSPLSWSLRRTTHSAAVTPNFCIRR